MTGPYYTVPAGALETHCRGCGKPMYWATLESGKRMPVDCAGDARCVPPTRETPGSGLPHWATCVVANRFRKRKPDPDPSPSPARLPGDSTGDV